MQDELWKNWCRESARFFNKPWLLTKWDTVEGIVWPPEKIDLMISDLAAKLQISSGQWLADVGAGPGWIGAGLAAKGARVVSVDFAEAMNQLAARDDLLLPIRADAAFLPLANNSMDRVLIYYFLMNFSEDKVIEFIREGMRALKPGGLLLAGQMPLATQSGLYDREKIKYLEFCRSRFDLGKDSAAESRPPITLFPDDFTARLERELSARVTALKSFNHFWREGQPGQCSWRVDYLVEKP